MDTLLRFWKDRVDELKEVRERERGVQMRLGNLLSSDTEEKELI